MGLSAINEIKQKGSKTKPNQKHRNNSELYITKPTLRSDILKLTLYYYYEILKWYKSWVFLVNVEYIANIYKTTQVYCL